MQKGGNNINNGGTDEMTTKEVSRLIDWLKANGHTYAEIENCIDYISNTLNHNQNSNNDTNTNNSND